MRAALAAGLVGLLGCVIGLFIDPVRTLGAWLVAAVVVAGVPLGALGFLLLGHLIRSDLLIALRPRLAAIASALPFVALIFVPVALATGALFPWAREEMRATLTGGAATWLQPDFFLARSGLYFLVWSALALLATRPARDGTQVERPRLAAVGLLLYFATVTLAGVDWIMSLAAPWSAAAFGLYFLAGALVAAVAFVAATGARPGSAFRLEEPARHSLGNLLLTVILFHAWVGFTQYYIIWIADLPFEVTWYLDRTRGGWALLAGGLVLVHAVVPATVLLLRVVKRSVLLLGVVGVWQLAARYTDVYWAAAPLLPQPHPHLLDLAAFLACAGLAIALAGMRFAR